MDQSISKKIALLNQTTLDSLVESDVLKIIKNFTETSLKILDADFGFAWWITKDKTKYHLIYKSADTPYEPELPRESGGNFKANKTRQPVFVENVIKKNYEEGFDVSMYMKSYVIIPITYTNNIYGSIVICFKNNHIFSEVDRQLSVSLGNTTAQSITIHDLIEKNNQNALVSMQQKADIEEDRVRSEFIVNAAHEIRTPLAIIRGNADVALINKALAVTNKKVFKDILYEAEHLSDMISDLITLSSKEPVLENINFFKEINIMEILDIVINRCTVLARKKNIKIKTSFTENLFIMGDKIQLEKLFLNLVRNSVSYGKNGGWIKIETIKADDKVVIKVSDNGVGISEEDLPKVFNRFFRADKSHHRDGGGTGLGLAIVRFITKAHGGTVSVESTLGKGTCFTVSLPML